MLDKFYYADVFVNGEEKTPWYVPQFMFGRSSRFSMSFPYIHYCDFRYDGIHIQSSGNQNEILFVRIQPSNGLICLSCGDDGEQGS